MKGVNVKIEKWSGLSFLNQGKPGSGSESQSDLMKSRRWVGGSCYFFFRANNRQWMKINGPMRIFDMTSEHSDDPGRSLQPISRLGITRHRGNREIVNIVDN